MGYQIFTARKTELTSLKNNAYANMMNKWVEQEHLADDKLQEMKKKNEKLKNLNSEYDADINTINTAFEGKDASAQYAENKKGYYFTDEYDKYDRDINKYNHAMDLVNGKTKSEALSELKSKYQNDRDAIEGDYSVNYQSITDDETAIEKEIQILETNVSEYTQEMSKAEQQEAQEIKTCIPGYSGAGGGQ